MFRIMTLNVNYEDPKRGPWPVRRELIEAAIRAAKPDVVALQAVTMAGDGQDQARQLAASLKDYGPVFEPAEPHGEGGYLGSAWLARVPSTGHGALLLSRNLEHEDGARRIVLRMQCRPEAGPLNVFNAHLSWVPEQTAENVRELLPYVEAFHGASVVVGDFNASPGSPALAPLAEHGWVDAWAALRPGDAGHTFDSADLRTRIDQAWVNTAAQRRLAGIEIVAGAPRPSGARLSDHLGLLVSFDGEH